MKLLALSLFSALASAMTITPEAPGVQHTTVPNVITETFDNLAPGYHSTYTSPIGTYSGAFVVQPDAYGGANQTQYASVGAQSGTYSYSLTFTIPQSYFGLYWSAGDFSNVLEFFSGNTLVASYSSAQAFSSLGSAYYGNPNNGADGTEPFAYLNFSGDTFDRITWTAASLCCGFESDNHAIAAVPEPGTWAMLLLGVGLLATKRLRR